MNLMAGICLLIQGIWDVRTKEIPTWVSLGFGICSFLYSICNQRDWICMIFALLPGIICLFIGYVTGQAIGYGDGILLCALGLLYSMEQVMNICMIASFVAGIVGLVLLSVFKKGRNYQIPFVPFLFLGWLFQYITDLNGGLFV